MSEANPVPATILTGFLGAGKTTLLNYVLQEQQEFKIGIIINEVGQIGIDGQLVETQSEDVIQINNGCLCCTVRGDFVRGIRLLLDRGGFDYLLIETTGIADPGPVAQTFFKIPQLASFVRLDSLITVVDAEHILAQIQEAGVSRKQLAMADFILLNKTDLVTPERLAEIEKRIPAYNRHATVIRTQHARVNLRELLNVNAFNPDRMFESDALLLRQLHSRHQDIASLSFRLSRPLDARKFQTFVERLAVRERVFRSKGILSISNSRHRAVFHGVNNRFTIFWDRAWENGEPRESQIVLIGKQLNRDHIERELEDCWA